MTDQQPDLPPEQPTAGPPGVPGWVKALGVVLLLIVVVLVVSRLAGVEHGPGRHSGVGPWRQPAAVAATVQW